MRRGLSAATALTLTVVVAIIVVGGCTRPKPTVEPSAEAMASPTIQAPPGATVVSVATPTLVPPGEMPPELTLTLAASPTAALTPTATPTSPSGVPAYTPTPTPTTPATSSATPGAPTVHVVQRGENLFRIALRYGTTVEAIAAANGIRNTQLIYVGQKLTIPQGGGTLPQPGGGRTHVVQPGENLFRIALRYGTTTQAIAAANNLPNIHLIYAGQVLRIP
jgi:LysM repeat protein